MGRTREPGHVNVAFCIYGDVPCTIDPVAANIPGVDYERGVDNERPARIVSPELKTEGVPTRLRFGLEQEFGRNFRTFTFNFLVPELCTAGAPGEG